MKYLTAATVIAGISGFVVITVAAWALGDASLAADFTAYWGLFFAATGVLGGLMQETTRAVSAARNSADRDSSAGPINPATPTRPARPMAVAVGVALTAAILVAATGPLWSPRLLSTDHLAGVLLMAAGLGSYAVQAAVAGLLSGCRLWRSYALMVAIDSGIRMVLALLAWWVGWQLPAFLLITVVGAATWSVLALASAEVRRALRSLTDVPLRPFLARTATAMAASGANAILITGFPTLIRLTNPDTTGQAVGAAAVIYAVTFTRAPLLVPLQQFQSALIVRFVSGRDRPLATLTAPLAAVWAIGLVGSALAWMIGPWLLGLVLPPEYGVPGAVLAALTVGATATASLMVTGSATLAFERHGLYLAGWVVATGVAIALLAGPWSLAVGAALALIVGPAAGLVVHAAGLRSGATVGIG